MKETLKITIAGYYGFGNLGDEAILESMVTDFRREFPGAAFEILIGGHGPTVSGPDITTRSWRDWPEVIESVRRCDCLVVGGGGIFNYYLRYSAGDFLRQSDNFAPFIFGLPVLARLLGKRSCIYGIGVSRFDTPAALEHAQMAARLADVCTVRDAASREILGASAPDIRTHADPAFRLVNEDLPATALTAVGIGEREPIVAIVARNWESAGTTAAWEGLATEVLRQFAIRHSLRLLFIPFHAITDLSNQLNYDPAVIARMREAIGRERTAELPYGLRPGLVSAALARCEMTISMRLHGAILSVRNATPFVALAYEPKVSNVMAGLGLERFVAAMPDDDAGAQALETVMEEVWANREAIHEQLREVACRAADDAFQHVEHLRRAILGNPSGRRLDDAASAFIARIAAEQTRRLAEADIAGRKAAAEAASLVAGVRRVVEAGQFDAAVTMLREWRPEAREAKAEQQYFLGVSLHGLDRNSEAALQHYNSALELGFDEFWTLYHRGQLLLSMGESARAEQDLRRALTLKADHEDAARLLDRCCSRRSGGGSGTQRLKVEFHVPISPTPDFLIRMHYLAASIDRWSGFDRSEYRIVVTVGADKVEDLYERCPWSRLYPLEWRWVEPSVFRQKSFYATAVDRFTYSMNAEAGVLLDADVLVCGPLDGWIDEVAAGEKLHGLPGHFSPFYYAPSGKPHKESWEAIFLEAGLPAPTFEMQHLGWGILHREVAEDSGMRWSPTFFNLGVLAARPSVLEAIGSSIYEDMAAVDRFQQTFFKCQIGLTLSMKRRGIEGALLPARYNFLNTPEMFDALPEDAADVRVFHFNQPTDIDKARDFASYGRLQKAIRREGLHPVNVILAERLKTLHEERILEDLRATGMEAPMEPAVDHWDLKQAVAKARAAVDGNRHEDALAVLEPVREHLADDAHAHYLLALATHVCGRDPQQALEYYGNAMRAGFDEFWVRYNRGALAMRLNMREQAEEDFSRALAMRPDHPEIQAMLAALGRA